MRADQHAVGEIDDVPIEQVNAAARDGPADGPKADKARAFKPRLSVRNLSPLKAEDIVDEFVGI
jgi:hypothetical protein